MKTVAAVLGGCAKAANSLRLQGQLCLVVAYQNRVAASTTKRACCKTWCLRGGQFENQSEVAEALGLDEPKARAASARPKRKRPPTVVRDLSFQDTNIGLDADEMGMPISSYPGLGLAAAPVVAKPAGPNCAAESAATATKPVDTRKRLSLFNDDIRGLVQLSFPTLVHNKSFDLFCADESVS